MWFWANKDCHGHVFGRLLRFARISRQGFQQREQGADKAKEALQREWVIRKVLEARAMHPVMGLKKIWYSLGERVVGRDKFLVMGVGANLEIETPKSYHRTTFSCKSARYMNELVDKLLDGLGQVWVTDITYYRIGDKFYYVSQIMDVYTRRIVGHACSDSLRAELCMRSLRMALGNRPVSAMGERLVHHSDKGSQYIFGPYTELLEKEGITVSMCQSVFENVHSERLNKTIKEEYLCPFGPKNLRELELALDRAVDAYNQRYHWELGCTPQEFEEKLKLVPSCQRTKMSVFVEETTRAAQKKIKNQLSFF
jgi:putative transposase